MLRHFFFILFFILSNALTFAQGKQDLPKGVQNFLFYEQERISRTVNEQRLVAPTAHEDVRYNPDGGRVFQVRSYWVDVEDAHAFSGDDISPELQKFFFREESGKRQVRFLVHPESQNFFAALIAKSQPAEVLNATATSSSRSCVVWADGVRPFVAKLSLDLEIGGVKRTIPVSEVARSIGTNNILNLEKQNLPKTFKYFPEVVGVMPKGMDRGGLIIREIPIDILTAKRNAIPFFALYAKNPQGPPLIADMIKKSGMSGEDFLRQKIIKPFVAQWLEMTVVHGISMEPHAQNLLLEVDSTGLPTGNFYHRDMGGFDVAFPYRRSLNLPEPSNLPVIKDFTKEYHQAIVNGAPEFEGALSASIYNHFEAGFVFNVDSLWATWAGQGWVAQVQVQNPAAFILKDEFQRQYAEMTGQSIQLNSMSELRQHVLNARKTIVSAEAGKKVPPKACSVQYSSLKRILEGGLAASLFYWSYQKSKAR